MTTNSTGERQDPLPPLSAEPYYRPTLISAMAASLGVIVGTLGPWATIVVFTVNGLETSWWGITTLTLGALCGVVLLVVLFWTRTPFRPHWAVPFAWAVAVAAVACLTLSLPTLIKVMTIPKTDILGIKIGPAVGWGLWLLVFSSAALCVTAIIVATQIAQKVQLLAPAGAGQSEARLVNGSRWVAIVASALIVISGIVYYSITWHEDIAESEASPSSPPLFPSFPSVTEPSFSSSSEPSFLPSASMAPVTTDNPPADATEPPLSAIPGPPYLIIPPQAATICRWLRNPAWSLGQIAMSTGNMLAHLNTPGNNIKAIKQAAAAACPDQSERVADLH